MPLISPLTPKRYALLPLSRNSLVLMQKDRLKLRHRAPPNSFLWDVCK